MMSLRRRGIGPRRQARVGDIRRKRHLKPRASRDGQEIAELAASKPVACYASKFVPEEKAYEMPECEAPRLGCEFRANAVSSGDHKAHYYFAVLWQRHKHLFNGQCHNGVG